MEMSHRRVTVSQMTQLPESRLLIPWRSWRAALCAIVAAAALWAHPLAAPHRHLLIIVDGLRPDYVTSDVMPNLVALGERGVVFQRHHSVYPTVTRVNASSISTGAYPESHGLMDAEVTAPRTPDADVRPADAPTIRTVAVSTPVPASTLADTPRVSRTTTTPPPVGEAPAAPPEPPAVVPASVPAPTAAAPAPRTADAEPASFTRSGGEAPVAARGETPVAASSVVPSSAVDEQSVKTALQRYRTAYERLDAKSARTVWPSVNEAALARAFGSLESQTLTFASCDVDFRGPAAVATCEGSTKYTPRYGSHEPREEPRVWTFTLKRNGAEWKIDSVKAGR